VLKSRDDFDFRDNIQRGPVASTYNGLQIENGGRDGTRMRILRRPPFDFVAVKRIHAYLAPRRPSRSLLRVQLFLAGMQPSHLENEKHKSSCSFAKRTFGRESARASARARAKGRGGSMQIYAASWSPCLSTAATASDNSARLLGYRIHERPRTRRLLP